MVEYDAFQNHRDFVKQQGSLRGDWIALHQRAQDVDWLGPNLASITVCSTTLCLSPLLVKSDVKNCQHLL
jgi:hypothetical protein